MSGAKFSVDVVVVGGGLAGHVAALTAAEAGASVCLLEKEPRLGGSTAMSGGFFAFAGTDEQGARGIEDSDATLRADLVASAEPAGDAPLIDRYVDRQLDVYEWLKSIGTTFSTVQLSAAQTVARSHLTSPRALLTRLADRLHASTHVSVREACAVDDLVVLDGRVAGVITKSGRGTEILDCNRGVILTTGGFSRSRRLLETFAPRQISAIPYGGAGCTGDGLLMAWKLGADMADLGYVSSSYGSHPLTTIEQHELLSAYYKGAIMVNRLGRRFIDESLSYKVLGDVVLEQPEGLAFQVFDSAVRQRSEPGVPLNDISALEEKGRILVADTLEGLARTMEVPPDALIATVSAYNDAIKQGTADPFGRTGLCNGVGSRLAVAAAPFYAYPAKSLMTTTYAGPRVTQDAEVLRVDGSVIDGLYAAGEVMGGFHGRSYMTGTGLGKAAVFGRIAGAKAARH